MKQSHLPHIDLPDHFQFITFRTHDSVDAFVKKLHARYQTSSQKQYAIDQYLDRSPKGAYLNGDVVTLLGDYLKQDQPLFDLAAYAIMPNHVHLLIKPLQELALVMNQIKGVSAQLINRQLGKKGKFWAAEYFDKLVRDEHHFNIVYEYIRNNSRGLGEPEGSPPRFYGIYE